MRTTLHLDDYVAESAKAYARREGSTLTAVIDSALRQFLAERRAPATKFKLKLETRSTAILPGVDIEDRDSLYERMGGRG
ncbi:MAG: type II toxin-antitoxin system VapB family antitoxin [Deltaproteobacteria bacterium]